MTETPIVCPFCNSQISAVADRAKPICPRCEAPLAPALISRLGSLAPARPTPLVVPGKRLTLLTVLGVMTLMTAVTIGYTFWTQSFRRQNDFKKGFVVSEPTEQAPDELLTVGLLPARCNVIGAVNVAELRSNPLLKEAVFEKTPRSIDWLREQLKNGSGLALEDIDQISLGIELTEKMPKIFVIVATKSPYDPQAVVKAFAPAKALALRNRPLVRFPLPYVGDGVVWCMSDRYLAFLFHFEPRPLDDLEAIPVRPRPKLEGSSATIQALVKERVDKQSIAWLAADLAPASGLADFLSLTGAKIEPYRPLLNAKALTLNIKTDQDIVVLGQVLAGAPKGMKALEDMLRDANWRGATSTKVEATPLDAAAEPWVTLQLRYAPAAIRELFNQGPGFKKN
jgi:hypothetical protein